MFITLSNDKKYITIPFKKYLKPYFFKALQAFLVKRSLFAKFIFAEYYKALDETLVLFSSFFNVSLKLNQNFFMFSEKSSFGELIKNWTLLFAFLN
jgi:hypothetical protein